MFVGQRREGFVVNLAEAFDLINLNPLGPVDGGTNVLADKNITTLALEVPADCLTKGDASIIGGWTTASLPRVRTLLPNPTFQKPEMSSADFVQVSRLGSPLVNEVVVPMSKKDYWNAQQPADDKQFTPAVLNPELAQLPEIRQPQALSRVHAEAGQRGVRQPEAVRGQTGEQLARLFAPAERELWLDPALLQAPGQGRALPGDSQIRTRHCARAGGSRRSVRIHFDQVRHAGHEQPPVQRRLP